MLATRLRYIFVLGGGLPLALGVLGGLFFDLPILDYVSYFPLYVGGMMLLGVVAVYVGGGAADLRGGSVMYAIEATWIDPKSFEEFVSNNPKPLVVFHAKSGWRNSSDQYLIQIEGGKIGTRALRPLNLPARTQVIPIEHIRAPGNV